MNLSYFSKLLKHRFLRIHCYKDELVLYRVFQNFINKLGRERRQHPSVPSQQEMKSYNHLI